MERVLVGVGGSPAGQHALAWAGSVACVGTRGLGGFSGLRIGRVPLQLVHHTDAAVILVPPEPST